ncbi:hypothetical protein AcW2_006845 [Taiwanofungus camphoratus]|nr:hypothetical protein AcW2_006845 [Antrodia cinnamomea]
MNMNTTCFAFATTGSASPRLHPASLVDPSLHEPALVELLQLPINWETMDYVVDCIVQDVNHTYARLSLAPPTRLKTAFFINFVKNVVAKSNMSMRVLLVALSYVDRVRERITMGSTEWACERLFLGVVMAATKATWSSALTAKQVVQCEFEFLQLIKYELAVREAAMLVHHNGLMFRVMRHAGLWRPPFPVPQYSGTGIYGSTISSRGPTPPSLPKEPVFSIPLPVCLPDCRFPCCIYGEPSSSSSAGSLPVDTPNGHFPQPIGTSRGGQWLEMAEPVYYQCALEGQVTHLNALQLYEPPAPIGMQLVKKASLRLPIMRVYSGIILDDD